MRAALLPTPGDPFLAQFWIRNFERVWRDEVDELHVLINGQTDDAVLAYLECAFAQAKPGAVSIIETAQPLEHGQALRLLLEACQADVVVLCEDDAYVRHPGAIAEQLAEIEAGVDVIGSPRGCASEELIQEAWRRWPDVGTTASLDEGHGLWPAFLFTTRETLLDTDRHFGARVWQPGDHVAGLDFTVHGAAVSADTLVSTAWQLRAKYQIRQVPQYRIADDGFIRPWLEHDPGWFHVGSLSSGYGMAFAARDDHRVTEVTGDMTGAMEWARRIYWWDRFVETADTGALIEQRAAYRAGLDHLIEKTGTRDTLGHWAHHFAGWVTWE